MIMVGGSAVGLRRFCRRKNGNAITLAKGVVVLGGSLLNEASKRGVIEPEPFFFCFLLKNCCWATSYTAYNNIHTALAVRRMAASQQHKSR